MDGYAQDTYGDRFADVYDDWYADVSDVSGTVQRVAELAGAGQVLELGCGTGRLLLPLADRGVEIVGLDASRAMLARLSDKASSRGLGERIRIELGDMADFDLTHHGPFAVVFIAFNTFFNLTSLEAQRSCLRTIARHLTPDGHLALECFVPGEAAGPDDVVDVARMTADRVVLRVSRRRPDQVVEGQLIDISDHGGVRLRPWAIRCTPPDELDRMASEAGFALVERAGGWRGELVDDETVAPVSIYRRLAGTSTA